MQSIILQSSWIITITLLTPVIGAICIYLLKLILTERLSKYLALIFTFGEFIF